MMHCLLFFRPPPRRSLQAAHARSSLRAVGLSVVLSIHLICPPNTHNQYQCSDPSESKLFITGMYVNGS